MSAPSQTMVPLADRMGAGDGAQQQAGFCRRRCGRAGRSTAPTSARIDHVTERQRGAVVQDDIGGLPACSAPQIDFDDGGDRR